MPSRRAPRLSARPAPPAPPRPARATKVRVGCGGAGGVFCVWIANRHQARGRGARPRRAGWRPGRVPVGRLGACRGAAAPRAYFLFSAGCRAGRRKLRARGRAGPSPHPRSARRGLLGRSRARSRTDLDDTALGTCPRDAAPSGVDRRRSLRCPRGARAAACATVPCATCRHVDRPCDRPLAGRSLRRPPEAA